MQPGELVVGVPARVGREPTQDLGGRHRLRTPRLAVEGPTVTAIGSCLRAPSLPPSPVRYSARCVPYPYLGGAGAGGRQVRVDQRKQLDEPFLGSLLREDL